MSAVEASYVTDYHHQISTPGWRGSPSCCGHRHKASSSQGSDLPPSFFESFTQTRRIDIRRRNRNCKYIKMYCQYLPHQGFTNLKAFLWFMSKLKLHSIAALAFKCKQNILDVCCSIWWRMRLWTLRCGRRATENGSCLGSRARHGVWKGRGKKSLAKPHLLAGCSARSIPCHPRLLSIHALGYTEDASCGPRLQWPSLESTNAQESCFLCFPANSRPSGRLSGKSDLHSTSYCPAP